MSAWRPLNVCKQNILKQTLRVFIAKNSFQLELELVSLSYEGP